MVKYCRPWASEQVEIIRAEDTRLAMPRQAAPYYKLALIEHGSREFYYRRTVSTVGAGGLVVIHPGEVNGSQAAAEAGATVHVLSLSPTLLLEAAGLEPERSGLPFFSLSPISDATLTAELLGLLAAFEGTASALEQQVGLFDFLALLFQRWSSGPVCETSGRERGSVERARALLEENYAEDVSLRQLAQTVGLNPCYLCRAFRRQIGIPPHAYQAGVRIARARTLLATGHPAGVVASLTGFFDQAHFTRLFTRYVKTTPAAYARAVAGRSISYKTADEC